MRHYQHRTSRVLHHEFTDRTSEQTLEESLFAIAEHNQIRMKLIGDVDDGLVRVDIGWNN